MCAERLSTIVAQEQRLQIRRSCAELVEWWRHSNVLSHKPACRRGFVRIETLARDLVDRGDAGVDLRRCHLTLLKIGLQGRCEFVDALVDGHIFFGATFVGAFANSLGQRASQGSEFSAPTASIALPSATQEEGRCGERKEDEGHRHNEIFHGRAPTVMAPVLQREDRWRQPIDVISLVISTCYKYSRDGFGEWRCSC